MLNENEEENEEKRHHKHPDIECFTLVTKIIAIICTVQ